MPKETLDLTGQVAAMDVDADARGQVAKETDAEADDGDVPVKPAMSTRRKAPGNERIQRLAVTARKVADKQEKQKQAKRPGLIRSLLAGMVALTLGTGPAYLASSAVVPAAESMKLWIPRSMTSASSPRRTRRGVAAACAPSLRTRRAAATASPVRVGAAVAARATSCAIRATLDGLAARPDLPTRSR